jgi:hypothetical protein
LNAVAPPWTGLLAHERYFWHDPGSGAGFSSTNTYMQPDHHPEAPETKRRLLGLLEVSGLADQLVRLKPQPDICPTAIARPDGEARRWRSRTLTYVDLPRLKKLTYRGSMASSR